jgi:hypothetical protein
VKAKLALGAVLVTGAAVLTHPAGAKTAARDGVLVLLIAAAGCAVAAAAAFAGARCLGRRSDRRRELAAASLPRVAACPAGRVTVHTPAGWPRLAPDCGCGRPAAVMVTYPDGRPDQPACAGCWRDTAVSEARAAGRSTPPEPDGCCGHGVPPGPDGLRRCGLCDLPAPGPVPAAPDNTPGHADMSEFETGS